MSTETWAALAAIAATVSAAASLLVWRQSFGVRWSLEVTNDERHATVITVVNTGGSTARAAALELEPTPRTVDITPATDVHPSGRLQAHWLRLLNERPASVVTVTWSRRIGGRGRWSSAL